MMATRPPKSLRVGAGEGLGADGALPEWLYQ